MQNVKVKKDELLTKLKENCADHRTAFLKAQEVYRETVIKVLDAELAAVRAGQPFVVQRLTVLVVPRDHTEEYERVIRMLEMAIETEIVLTEREFMTYVDDNWGWMAEFANTVSTYGVSNAKLAKYTE